MVLIFTFMNIKSMSRENIVTDMRQSSTRTKLTRSLDPFILIYKITVFIRISSTRDHGDGDAGLSFQKLQPREVVLSTLLQNHAV
jgi:hypothetical protein